MSTVIRSVDVIVTSPGRNYVLLKVMTDDGVVGWGDATLNGRELAVASYLRDHIAPILVGRDARRIEDTWQLLYRGAYWRRGPVTMAAIGAVDLALWDILGKSAGMPVYQLLGGKVRDGVLAYTHAFGWDLPRLLDDVDSKREAGYRALRVQSGVPGLESIYGVRADGAAYEPATRHELLVESWDPEPYLRHVPEILAQTRDHVGVELALLHDVHHRLTPVQAARLARVVEPLALYWLEDVTPLENQELLRAVRASSTTPLAAGEVFNSVWDCLGLIRDRSIDYIRTCVMHAGGISHVRRIFQLAELYQVKAAPHGPSDVSPVTIAASLHLGMATPNFGIQEYMGYPAVVDDVFTTRFSFDQGYFRVEDSPGLGVEINEEAAKAYPYRPAYLPIARLRDGSMTDW